MVKGERVSPPRPYGHPSLGGEGWLGWCSTLGDKWLLGLSPSPPVGGVPGGRGGGREVSVYCVKLTLIWGLILRILVIARVYEGVSPL